MKDDYGITGTEGSRNMPFNFMNSLRCVREDEKLDYQSILIEWKRKTANVALMPAIWWYGGTFNLFDQKAKNDGENMIWIVPAGQSNFFWINDLKKTIVEFYETDQIDLGDNSHFPGIEPEEFEECILLHSDDIQSDTGHVIMGANVILVRLSLLSGRDALVFILLDHQNNCWKNIIEKYHIRLKWLVDSGRGTDDYYARTKLYQLMKHTCYPELLPSLYFKGLYNKGEIPENFQFQYAMLSQPGENGYDKWNTFSAVFDTRWNS